MLDVDPRHGGDHALAGLEAKYGPLPATPTARTGGGGLHLLFGLTDDQEVRNRAGVVPGIDTRGDGGFIVAMPSVHASGEMYRWDADRHPAKLAPAPAPAWLLELVSASNGATKGARAESRGRIPDGERNATLASIAGRLRRIGLHADEMEAALNVINARRCESPLAVCEVSAIARSVARYRPAEDAFTMPVPLSRAGTEVTTGTEDPGVPWPLSEILARIVGVAKTYLVLPSASDYDTLALWLVHTHVFERFEATPYLAITSAEKGSGKSRVLDLAEQLVARPWRAVLPSDAVIFRKVEVSKPTLLLDESDAIFGPKAKDHEGLRALLNAGFQAGSTVPRCVGKEMRIQDFAVFCPKALAGIGALPDTVHDRSIQIRMRRRTRSEPVARWRRRDALRTTTPIRAHIERWALSFDPGEVRPSIPDELGDRAADGWEPLLAIADVAGDSWPERVRSAAIALSRPAGEAEPSLGTRLLADMRQVWREDETVLFTCDLCDRLNALEESPWGGFSDGKGIDARGLARQLKRYGIGSKQVRAGAESLKGYRVEDCAEAWTRYAPVPENGSPPRNSSARGTGETPETAETSSQDQADGAAARPGCFVVSAVSSAGEQQWGARSDAFEEGLL